MDYRLLVPTYIDMWKEVMCAEVAGFTHAWFPDSQLIWSDCYTAMALAAERTTTIKLGTLVSIPSNRIAPVTASAIATINKLAPGRTILALGTGYTGRNATRWGYLRIRSASSASTHNRYATCSTARMSYRPTTSPAVIPGFA